MFFKTNCKFYNIKASCGRRLVNFFTGVMKRTESTNSLSFFVGRQFTLLNFEAIINNMNLFLGFSLYNT